MLRIETTTRTPSDEYHEGREITVYRPILSADEPTFSGELTFAVWEVWTDEPKTIHAEAKKKVLDNAKEVLKKLVERL